MRRVMSHAAHAAILVAMVGAALVGCSSLSLELPGGYQVPIGGRLGCDEARREIRDLEALKGARPLTHEEARRLKRAWRDFQAQDCPGGAL